MNQEQSTFDNNFDNQHLPRRRDLMPKWMIIYTWVIIALGVFSICYVAWNEVTFDANDVMANDPQFGDSYRSGFRRGQFIPGMILVLMGGLIWQEIRGAIRFHWAVAIFWAVIIAIAMIGSGISGLTVGITLPFFLPYWIGLRKIQHRWENGATRGNGNF